MERLKDAAANQRLHERLAELLLSRPAFEWETLANATVTVLAAVRSSSVWLDNEHARRLGAVTLVDDPLLGPTRMAGPPGHPGPRGADQRPAAR